MVCRLRPASFTSWAMGWGCSPVSLISRGEREGGTLNSSPPPLCLGQGSRESKTQGKGTKPALEGCPVLGHWNKRPPQAVTGQQCRPLKPPLSSRPSGPLSPRGKQRGHPSAPPNPNSALGNTSCEDDHTCLCWLGFGDAVCGPGSRRASPLVRERAPRRAWGARPRLSPPWRGRPAVGRAAARRGCGQPCGSFSRVSPNPLWAGCVPTAPSLQGPRLCVLTAGTSPPGHTCAHDCGSGGSLLVLGEVWEGSAVGGPSAWTLVLPPHPSRHLPSCPRDTARILLPSAPRSSGHWKAAQGSCFRDVSRVTGPPPREEGRGTSCEAEARPGPPRSGLALAQEPWFGVSSWCSAIIQVAGRGRTHVWELMASVLPQSRVFRPHSYPVEADLGSQLLMT